MFNKQQQVLVQIPLNVHGMVLVYLRIIITMGAIIFVQIILCVMIPVATIYFYKKC